MHYICRIFLKIIHLPEKSISHDSKIFEQEIILGCTFSCEYKSDITLHLEYKNKLGKLGALRWDVFKLATMAGKSYNDTSSFSEKPAILDNSSKYPCSFYFFE